MSLMEDGGLSEYLNEGNYNDEDALPDGSEENPFGPDDEHIDGDSGTAGVKVEPKKRCIRNPKPRLTIQLLRGPKGIHTIEDHFKGLKLRGKGYEREDLDEIMERLQSWGSFLYPLDTFDNLLNTIERLNKKRELQTHMARYRAGLLESMKMKDDKVGAENGEGGEVGDEAKMVARPDDEPFDEIDALLDQQIAMSMMTNDTPQKPSSSRRFDELMASSSFSGPFNQSTVSFNIFSLYPQMYSNGKRIILHFYFYISRVNGKKPHLPPVLETASPHKILLLSPTASRFPLSKWLELPRTAVWL